MTGELPPDGHPDGCCLSTEVTALTAELEKADTATGRVLALAASWEATATDLARRIAVAVADPRTGPEESTALVTAEATCRRHARQLRRAVAR